MMMKIFYYCFGSAHSSVISSCIHLGMLPQNRIPELEEIVNLPYYDQTESSQIGTPFFMGEDEFGYQVYILGMGSYKKIVKNSLQSIMDIYEIPQEKILLINSLNLVNTTTRIGGFLSRALGLVSIGRPLTVIGIRHSYWHFVQLVLNTKEILRINK